MAFRGYTKTWCSVFDYLNNSPAGKVLYYTGAGWHGGTHPVLHTQMSRYAEDTAISLIFTRSKPAGFLQWPAKRGNLYSCSI